jgi:hypothetical protein
MKLSKLLLPGFLSGHQAGVEILNPNPVIETADGRRSTQMKKRMRRIPPSTLQLFNPSTSGFNLS